jgi:hypothetical protein
LRLFPLADPQLRLLRFPLTSLNLIYLL